VRMENGFSPEEAKDVLPRYCDVSVNVTSGCPSP
jgi:hypothetical protein